MRIREFCMFHNEHAALAIKRSEAGRWIDELHLCESNRTFQGGARALALADAADGFVHVHPHDGAARFHPPLRWGFSRYWPFFRRKKMARRNETMQRDLVHEALADVAADDIVILSDIDEILDARRADEVIDAARRHGIVSVELRHTLYYLDLYSANWHEVWPGSPANYAYRVFIMTGAWFHALSEGSDRLRRRGEWGRLDRDIPLLRGFRGFHHSWLGGAEAALDKLNAYAHSPNEHRPELIGEDGRVSPERLASFIRAGQSIFPGNRLEIHSFDEIEPLQSVMERRDDLGSLLLS